MNKTNYLKIIAFAAFALFLNTTVNAQDSSSRMEREKAASRVQQNEVSAKKRAESKVMWMYTVVEMTVTKDEVKIVFDEIKAKPKTQQEEIAVKMSVQSQERTTAASKEFSTETEVLNFLSQQGMELVSVVPKGIEGNTKMYYFRSKLPE